MSRSLTIGNLRILGSTSGSSFTGSFFSGSFIGDGTEIVGVISSSYSVTSSHAAFAISSSHALRADEADSIAFDNITGKPTLISSSLQFNDLTSPFTGSFTGSFTGDGSGLTGVTTDSVAFDDITGKPTLVSSSLQFDDLTSPFTGSFTGSFAGDGTNLTGVTADSVAFDDITGKPTLISSSLQFNDLTSPFTGSFTGSFVGDGSGLTGVVHGTGSTNYLPIWEDSTTIISSSITSTVAGSGAVVTRFNNADRLVIDKNSSITSGDPAFNVSQDGVSKVEFGWDDDGEGFGFMYNYSGEGLKFGTAGANPIMYLRSGSAEITGELIIDGITSGSIFSGSFVGDGSGLTGVTTDSVAFNDITGKPTLVSSSIQIDHDQTTNYDANEHFTQANITTVGTVTAGNVNAILPSNLVSSSLQFNNLSSPFTGSFTGSFVGDGSGLTGITGNLSLSGTTTNGLITFDGDGTGTVETATYDPSGPYLVMPGKITIGAGQTNNGTCSSITGGSSNTIGSSANCSFIGGGNSNCINANANQSNINGGSVNIINAGATTSNIGGGTLNTITGNTSNIGGGCCNCIEGCSNNVGGGLRNCIVGSSLNSIDGGADNLISGSSVTYSHIVGGRLNSILLAGANNFIGGGFCNRILTGVSCAAIIGGRCNTITHNFSNIIGSDLTSTATYTTFVNNLNVSGSITGCDATFSSTVTATNFILSSDESLKENIQDLDVKVDAKWKSYKFKDSDEIRYGVIAQELEQTNPELVRIDDRDLKSVAYIDLLVAKVAELEARLDKAGL